MTKRSKAIQNFNIEYHVQYVDNKKSLEGRGEFFFLFCRGLIETLRKDTLLRVSLTDTRHPALGSTAVCTWRSSATYFCQVYYGTSQRIALPSVTNGHSAKN